MGLSRHAINFLRLAAKHKPLGKVATLGRQGLHIKPDELKLLMGLKQVPHYGQFCEQFLIDHFGATDVESFDHSDFEGATHIVDLNKPIDMPATYDTVIDSGTMEHIFNAPQGFKTASQICRIGGRILHMVPANNLCNHGFWQFSPELFVSLYSEVNGYSDTKIYLADVGESDFWYEVKPPKNGHWGYFSSSRGIYVLVWTTKNRDVLEFAVQQGQYVNDWKVTDTPILTKSEKPSSLKSFLERTPLFKPARAVYRSLRDPDATLKTNRDLIRREVRDLIYV